MESARGAPIDTIGTHLAAGRVIGVRPEGVTRLAMMGDLSRGKRWWEVGGFRSGGRSEDCPPGLGFAVYGGDTRML